MRSIHNYVQAVKARREENGDEGFSLIELIVVVVILGILAAVAIPVFTGLQAQAEDSARESVAANAASQYAAEIANDDEYVFAEDDFANLENSDEYAISLVGTGTTIDDFCIQAVSKGKFAASGPGCTAPLTGAVSG